MEYDHLYVLLFVAFVVLPAFFWIRVKYLHKRRDSVKAVCQKCGFINRLPQIQNFHCMKCKELNVYRDESGNLLTSEFYNCEACNHEVPEGIITCTYCGKQRRVS